jgi:hypothetical protein
MQTILLIFLVLSLITTFAVDTRQKRRKFMLEEANHRRLRN